MSRWIARVHIMPRSGLLDPQGTAIEHALTALDFGGVRKVRVGKTIDITVDAASEQEARAQVQAMCDRLMANPVTEDYAIDSVEAA